MRPKYKAGDWIKVAGDLDDHRAYGQVKHVFLYSVEYTCHACTYSRPEHPHIDARVLTLYILRKLRPEEIVQAKLGILPEDICPNIDTVE